MVDRIEGDWAVLLVDGQPVDWPVSALPPGAGEGSRLLVVLERVPAESSADERQERLRARHPHRDVIDL